MNVGKAKDFSKVTFVFLDRDGVINGKPPAGHYVTCWEEFELLPGVAEAIASLNRSGRKVIVVTNQRGVAQGLYSVDELAQMHRRLQQELARHGAHLDAIYVCPHEEGECDCRKPKIGLFEQAFRDFPAAHAGNSVMIGDSLRDIEAGRNAGMRSVFIDDAGTSSKQHHRARSLAQLSVSSLADFVNRHLCAQHPV
jgi:D-glycero-D-manno-heptose 1,7-bisphosphate phosphatase